MLQVATILLGITALGGLLMAGIRFATKTNPPAWLAMLHGLLAASGLTLLIYAICMMSVPSLAILALLLFLAAASGGAVMSLVYKWHQRLLPAWLVIAHAITAAIAFTLLAVVAFASPAV
ncbi:hypothetical protein [Lysobacter sp. CFH 32150]|uniref:hypothetical protein n=1 Tax=Lysobacter sp. CFH 32150 TaxID=2927128 RepID=UPI001FA72E38|nr:hypothetical protein [Lysobacter sp. CFH 32150]MCI4568959.1 hypothetical protein [Lysobacter sp. CFH 32150]